MPMDAHMKASQEMCRSALMHVHPEALMRVVSPLENGVKQRGEEQVLERWSGSLPAVEGTLGSRKEHLGQDTCLSSQRFSAGAQIQHGGRSRKHTRGQR